MFLAAKIEWARIVFTILAAGTFVQSLPPIAAGSDSNKEEVAGFVVKNEIKKIQETLRSQGHYRGEVDGVFGLRTRASIRAYQKAESLPITGQVDIRTADALGVRPESTWKTSIRSGQEVGYADKPSAGIKRAKRRADKTPPAAGEDDRRAGVTQPPAENDKPRH